MDKYQLKTTDDHMGFCYNCEERYLIPDDYPNNHTAWRGFCCSHCWFQYQAENCPLEHDCEFCNEQI